MEYYIFLSNTLTLPPITSFFFLLGLTLEWIFIFIMLSKFVTWERKSLSNEHISFSQPLTHEKKHSHSHTYQIQCHYKLKVSQFPGVRTHSHMVDKSTENQSRPQNRTVCCRNHITHPNISHIKCIRRRIKHKSCICVWFFCHLKLKITYVLIYLHLI